MSRELIKRLTACPRLRAALDVLQPKLIALSSDAPATPIEVEASDLNVDSDIERINNSKFTSKGDHPVVVGLYKKYVRHIVGVLQKTLGSLQMQSTEGMSRVNMPIPDISVPPALPVRFAPKIMTLLTGPRTRMQRCFTPGVERGFIFLFQVTISQNEATCSWFVER